MKRSLSVSLLGLGFALIACDKPSPTTTTSASASASGATSAMAPVASSSSATAASPPVAASPADPQDAKLGAFELDVAQQLVNAAISKPVDPKWISKDPARSVAKLTDPDDQKLLGVLGKDLKIVLVEMELSELAQPSPSEHHEINAHAIALADKSVHWGTVAGRHEKSALQDPTPGLATSAPAATEAGDRVIKNLASSCKLSWLAPSDIAQAPATVQPELATDMNVTKTSCAEIAKVKGEWRAHIDDIRVLVSGNGHFGFLTSVFDIDEPGDRLVLSPLHAEVISDAQLKKP